ncbi:hypothetical protein KTAU_39300 [Thermogemmatispora aurantia]|uniref:Type II secretion system protein GspE N-terminal domain-containing protein n=1 Tax=Thermogemmatispora aurantia TaxID=2045279 RepID=A0A5J4KD10_9CHLR|nr:hypothetical protein [Thermogemmatispora aurantia]GER85295.1 hypothetical protein KTAU_39300 [Thermogemmatispora aurantia]
MHSLSAWHSQYSRSGQEEVTQQGQEHNIAGQLASDTPLRGKESVASMGTLKEMAYLVRQGPLPRLPSLRYVPLRYRGWLPMPVARRYQCLVIGVAQGVATVALARPGNAAFYTLLEEITACTVFPVLVSPSSLRLAIRRLERDQRHSSLALHPAYFLHPRQFSTLSRLPLRF